MRYSKIISLLLLICIAVSLLSSCHGKKKLEEFEAPKTFNEDKEYEIVFWAKNENNQNQRDVYDNAIKEFEKLYPNINVTIKHYTDYGEIYNDVITNIQTGTTPNVCITYPDHIATYMKGENVVVPLSSLAKDKGYGFGGSELKFDSPNADEMVSEFLEECYIAGELYAVPFMRSTEACYVNKTYVEALGFELPEVLTWDFVWEVSEAALKKGSDGKYKVNGQTVMKPVIYKSTDNMMIQMLRQKNAGYSTENGKITMFNDTTEELLRMVSERAKSGEFDTFKRIGYPANFLNKGQCIFAIDSTAGATWMGAEAPLMDVPESSIADFETVVYPVPQFDADNVKMISQGPSLCIFNKEDPDEVMASWIFVQYLLTNEVQIAYSETEGYLPVTKKAQTSEEFTDYLSRRGENNELYYKVKIDTIKMLMDHTENTFTAPVFDGSTSLRNAAGEMIESVTKETKRKKAVVSSAYIDKLYTDVSSLYKLDMIDDSQYSDVPTSSGGENVGGGSVEKRPLPTMSVVLLCSLGSIWLAMGAYVAVGAVKKHRMSKNKEKDVK